MSADPWADLIEAAGLRIPRYPVDRTFYVGLLEGALDNLQPAERRILQLRFGLTGNPPMADERIAARFGVEPVRIASKGALALTILRLRWENTHGVPVTEGP